MNTPICDFINSYIEKNVTRLHMPGHKGIPLLGFEKFDITEVSGADELYVADGIIGESERNTSGLFGSAATLYSTEGSSQCIRAMLQLVMCGSNERQTIYCPAGMEEASSGTEGRDGGSPADRAANSDWSEGCDDGSPADRAADSDWSEGRDGGYPADRAANSDWSEGCDDADCPRTEVAGREHRLYAPYILAARNAHKAFIYGLALTGLEVEWLYPEGHSNSLCSCPITAKQVEDFLSKQRTLPLAVYITSPDYLGNIADIKGISGVCHSYGLPLLVDNAHGAYLRFLTPSLHPLDQGADMCCDSAHKTLPVLTGGAYLHISSSLRPGTDDARAAMALYGSTSPSYLIMASLDRCNQYLADRYKDRLAEAIALVAQTKESLRANGWLVEPSDEPMKIVIRIPHNKRTADTTLPQTCNTHSNIVVQRLRQSSIEYEYADDDFVVLMPSAETTAAELSRLVSALGSNELPYSEPCILQLKPTESIVAIRDAVFSPAESIPVTGALGRICATPTVSCPPAIPIAVSGERITEDMLKVFTHYGIEKIRVLKHTEI